MIKDKINKYIYANIVFCSLWGPIAGLWICNGAANLSYAEILLIIIISVSIGIFSILYYRIQQLKKELSVNIVANKKLKSRISSLKKELNSLKSNNDEREL